MLHVRARDRLGAGGIPLDLDGPELLTRAPFFLLLGEFPSTLLLELIGTGQQKKGCSAS